MQNVCWNAVKSGKVVIANAEDLYKYCKHKLEHDSKFVRNYISKRHMIYVDTKEIIRNQTDVQTLVGTRCLHSIKNTGIPLKVQFRNLSCCCPACKSGEGENCVNSQYVEYWNEKTLAVGKTTKRKQVEQPGIYI